ncbi:hypothetical protein CEXT_652291 [Caerostris extrusa]|uniref:Uncharacterized protein n=1 Tax=Caerostris extrusa TaxID=172846 RepID=A0AAV4VGV7_CAEEX|nr:hypothetical protein CEXT_652291 [Caerostris extrusa]
MAFLKKDGYIPLGRQSLVIPSLPLWFDPLIEWQDGDGVSCHHGDKMRNFVDVLRYFVLLGYMDQSNVSVNGFMDSLMASDNREVIEIGDRHPHSICHNCGSLASPESRSREGGLNSIWRRELVKSISFLHHYRRLGCPKGGSHSADSSNAHPPSMRRRINSLL